MTTKPYIPIEDIYKATDNGLNIITSYYQNASKCISNKNAKFKIRNEKTASASLHQDKNIWFVKDFGSGNKRMNGVEVVMYEESLEFAEALDFINKRFCNGKLNGKSNGHYAEPKFSKVKPPEEFEIEFKESFSDFELKTLGKLVSEDVCEKYNLKAVKYYINKKGYKFESTDQYPIFCFDFENWKKIYQPLSSTKKYRFFYVGERPKDYIFGLDKLKNEYGTLRKQVYAETVQKLRDNNTLEKQSEEQINEKTDRAIEPRLKDLIICSGDRDALNVASTGYNVIWLNSETSILSKNQYFELKKLSKQIYNVPDIDKTGINQGNSLGLKYLDIITIWMPDTLRKFKDFRGNSCKDVTDFFTRFNNPGEYFDKIKRVSIPFRFWDAENKPDGTLKKYNINVTAFYEFLKANGYYRYEDKTNKQGYVYIRFKGNIVERIEPETIKTNVKDFINNYLEKKLHPVPLRNMFYKSRQTDEPYLSNLPKKENLDFKTYGKDYQYWFFPNVAWKITKDEIIQTKISEVEKLIWETDIKDKCQRVKKTDVPLIEINYTKDYLTILKSQEKSKIDEFSEIDKYELKINDKDFNYLKFLINTSRMYWKRQKDGIELSKTEQKEQQLHFINKIYALGYLAHKYKDSGKAWTVFNMDAKLSDIGKSYGGSGKSILMNSIEYVNKTFYIGGRNPHKTKDNFIFDGVDEHTFNINIDDADQYLDFDFFFPIITGKMNVNPKNNKPFTLDFPDSPKLGISSNFTLRKVDPSTERRILYTAFSDYYHKKDSEGHYSETRTPDKEFGKNLFTDFTDDEWNKFYNLIAISIQVYLKFDKIEAPMGNIEKRNLMTQIGQGFLDWANEYFINENKLNVQISKEEVFHDCKQNIPQSSAKFLTPTSFKKKIQLYCKYKDWTFNPKESCNNGDRIMVKVGDGNQEFFYIDTSFRDMPF